jgi:hypothetical protein
MKTKRPPMSESKQHQAGTMHGGAGRAAVPWLINALIMFAASAIALALLWFASHTESWIWVIVAAIGFSYVNNTMF